MRQLARQRQEVDEMSVVATIQLCEHSPETEVYRLEKIVLFRMEELTRTLAPGVEQTPPACSKDTDNRTIRLTCTAPLRLVGEIEDWLGAVRSDIEKSDIDLRLISLNCLSSAAVRADSPAERGHQQLRLNILK